MNSTAYEIGNSVIAPGGAPQQTAPPARPLRPEDLRARVAAALKFSPEQVEIEGQRTRYLSLFQQCWGAAGGARFFAKIFLVDVYPIPPRFATPWEEVETPAAPHHPVEEQMMVEESKFQRMRALAGGQNVPALLACSLPQRILIYERVAGVRLDDLAGHHLANRCWPRGRNTRSMEAAMFHAGAWLRTLHRATAQGFEDIEPEETLDGLRALIRNKHLEGSSAARLALRVCEAGCRKLRSVSPVRVPVALNHGDFTLPNLLWNADCQHLWVVDFELSSFRSILHDLSTLPATLRAQLLYPLTSPRTMECLEAAFWKGYGPVSEVLRVMVETLACAWPCYHALPRMWALGERRGRWGSVKSFLYQRLLQKAMMERVVRTLEWR